MDSTIEPTCAKSRRRSSIFKPEVPEEEHEFNETLNYSIEYKQRLEQEKEQWKEALETLKKEYLQLKSKLSEQKELLMKVELPSEDLEFFDHTLYSDCLQSIQHLCTRFECLMHKKQQETVKDKIKDNIFGLIKNL
ncbi:hypothetical protein Trydic_g18820 [Trypoxylus dichotomus]